MNLNLYSKRISLIGIFFSFGFSVSHLATTSNEQESFFINSFNKLSYSLVQELDELSDGAFSDYEQELNLKIAKSAKQFLACPTGTAPTVTAFAIQPSCVDNLPQNDGYLQLSSITNGDRVAWSTGNTFTGDADYANATIIGALPFQFNTGLDNSDHLLSIVMDDTVKAKIPTIGLRNNATSISNLSCNCTDHIYLNDEDTDEVHKFQLGAGGGLTEIGNPWIPASLGLREPHGLAIDNNGYIYIGDTPGGLNGGQLIGEIKKLNCNGEMVDTDPFPSISSYNANYGSNNGFLYFPNNNTNSVELFELCSGNKIGEMDYPATVLSWGFYNDDENWYTTDKSSGNVYSGSLDIGLYTMPSTVNATFLFSTGTTNSDVFSEPGLMGITKDVAGNFYIVINNLGGSLATEIRKYSPTGTLVTTITDNTNTLNLIDGQAGFYGGRGIAYSENSNLLYLGSRENCIAVFDTSLVEQPALNIGNPNDTRPKGIGILSECCPTNSNVVIDTVLCNSLVGDQLFLQDLINCSGTICEGVWEEGMGNTSLTYNTCDNSITIDALNACGTFTLESDGTGANAQCGAFVITVNINVTEAPAAKIFAIQPSCTNGVVGSDGILQIAEISSGSRFNWSTGTTYTGSENFSDATDTTGMSFPIILKNDIANPSGSTSFTVRVFSAPTVCGENCFTDYTVTMNEQDCTVGCTCTDYLIVNDPQNNNGQGFVHKFAINGDSTLTEIFSDAPTNTQPWIPAGVIQSPHGLGVDLNGNYYIGGDDNFDIRKVDCDGNVFPTSEFVIDAFGYNMTSYKGILYSNAGDGKITAYDPCDGSSLGYVMIDTTGVGTERSDWGFEIAEDGTFYVTYGFVFFGSYVDMYIYRFQPTASDFTNNTVFPPLISSNDFPAMGSNADIYGITTDDAGNIYVMVWELNSGANDPITWILKFDSSGNLVASNSEPNDGVVGGTGFSMTRGLRYYKELDVLFLSGADDCIAMVDPNTLNYIGTVVGYVPNQDGKALALAKECCPTNNNMVIDTTLCTANIGDKIFLQELINCSGAICEGVWQEGMNNTGMTYNSCDNTITIDALNACGAFSLESDGTGNNPQCGAFKITVNINVVNLSISASQTNCTDNGNGTFTADYDVIVDWSNATCTYDEMISVTHNGSVIGTIDANTDISPDTFSVSLSANGNGTQLFKAAFTGDSGCAADSLSFKSPTPCPADVAICSSATGCLGGNAFEDFNCNGIDDTNDSGVQGVQVVVYDCDNTAVDTAWTDCQGDWQICGLTDGEQYRVEFLLSTTLACIYQPSHTGTDNASAIQFLSAPKCTKFALSSAADYNEGINSGINVYIPCYLSGDPLNPINPNDAGNLDWFVGFDYSLIGGVDEVTIPNKLTGEIIGATWGTAYSPQANLIFTSAFMKRHTGLGVLGTGGIYTIAPNTFTAATFYDLDANGYRTRADNATAPTYGDGSSYTVDGNGEVITFNGATDPLTGEPSGLGVVGTNSQRDLSLDPTQPSYDPASFDQTGKVSLGGLEISEDGKYLFVMNLYSRQIVRMELDNPANPTGVVGVQTVDMPTIACNNGQQRPFALKYHQGSLYLGTVCSGENNGSSTVGGATDLFAYVFEMPDPTNAFAINSVPILSFPLNYQKGRKTNGGGGSNHPWIPWSNDASMVVRSSGPTPILSDIEFTENGDLITVLMDRGGNQKGWDNREFLSSANNATSIYETGGDILIAGKSNCSDSGFILENNGSFTSVNGTTYQNASGVLTMEGPGGEEFFNDENWQGGGVSHEETAIGSVLHIAGSGEIMFTAIDPHSASDGGTGRLSLIDGAKVQIGGDDATLGLYDDGNGFPNPDANFVKGIGLGEIAVFKKSAPLEIGNYVWCDSIENGIQDACERGIDSLIVRLYDADDNLVGQDTTVNGNYYFNQYNVDTSGITVDLAGVATPNTGWSGLAYNADYHIVFGYGQFSHSSGVFTIGSDIYDGFTTANAGSNDNIDSDVTAASYILAVGSKPGLFPVIEMTTSATGCGDHKYDMGILCNSCATVDSLSATKTICSGGVIDTLAITTTFSNPDSIAFVYFETAQTDSMAIYTGGTGIDTVQITSGNDTVRIFEVSGFTNNNIDNTPDSFYVYAIAHPTPTTNTCRPYEEILVIVNACDWGDLPDTSATTTISDYQTQRSNNGPVHIIDPAINLGSIVDGETDGQESNDALGDAGDEDGLMLFPTLDISSGSLLRLPLSYENTTGNPAEIEAWIDWNANGEFDAGEMVYNETDPSLGYMEVNIPNNAVTGEYLGLRIRISNHDNMTPYGLIDGGEVEDYLIGIDCPTQICIPIETAIIRRE